MRLLCKVYNHVVFSFALALFLFGGEGVDSAGGVLGDGGEVWFVEKVVRHQRELYGPELPDRPSGAGGFRTISTYLRRLTASGHLSENGKPTKTGKELLAELQGVEKDAG